MGPHPFPTIVRDFQAVISREIKSQLAEKESRLPDAVIVLAVQGSDGQGGDGVLDVDQARHAEREVRNGAVGRHQVEMVSSVTDGDMAGMEVGARVLQGIAVDGYVRRTADVRGLFHEQETVRPDLRRILREGFLDGLVGLVDVQMVGVGRADDGRIGRELQHRAVEFVGFCHHIPAAGLQQQVAAVVFRNAAQKSIASDAGLGEQVRGHR